MLRYLADGERNYRKDPIECKIRSYWELQAVVAGRIAPSEPQRRHAPRARCLWVWPALAPHGWTGDQAPARVLVIAPARVPEALRRACELAARAGQVLTWDLADGDIRWLSGLVRELAADLARPNHLTALRQERAVIEVALRVLAACPPRWREPTTLDPGQVAARALAWLGEHLAEAPDARAVAAAVHVSPAHLRRICHRALGRSPRDAFLDLALERADELLLSTERPLESVAFDCGFGSAAAFSRAYARRRGHPPGRTRRLRTVRNLQS